MKKFLFSLIISCVTISVSAATVTHEIITADTGATPNTSGAFTPLSGDILIACITASDTVQATATLTNSVGVTFTQILRATYRTSADSIYCFVSDVGTNAVSQTVTFDTASDAATGTVIAVASVTGMFRYGLAAIKQSAKEDNQAASGTPAPAFGASALTGNPTIGVVGNSTNPAGMTTPTNWTERGDTGYATPTTGMEYVSRDSGFTGTTITWGNTSASAFGSMILELDASASTTFAFIGSCGGNITSSSGTTVDCSASLNVASGDLLVGACNADTDNANTFTIASVSGSPANTFTVDAADYSDTVAAGDYQGGYKINASADATMVPRCTLSVADDFRALIVLQFRPAASLTVTKDVASLTQSSGVSLTSGTATTTGTDEVAVGFSSEQIVNSWTVGNIASVRGIEPSASAQDSVGAWYRILTATFAAGAATATVTSGAWVGNMMTFKAVAPAGSCTLSISLMGVGCR